MTGCIARKVKWRCDLNEPFRIPCFCASRRCRPRLSIESVRLLNLSKIYLET